MTNIITTISGMYRIYSTFIQFSPEYQLIISKKIQMKLLYLGILVNYVLLIQTTCILQPITILNLQSIRVKLHCCYFFSFNSPYERYIYVLTIITFWK